MNSVLSPDPPRLELPPPLIPLTEHNLQIHTLQTNPDIEMTHTAATQSGSTSLYDTTKDLRIFGAELDSEEVPPELTTFITEVVYAMRNEPPSPAAKNLHENAELSRLGNEADLSGLINRDLMFLRESKHGGEHFIDLSAEANLNVTYVAHPTKSPTDTLTQPRPDFTNGYISGSVAKAASKGILVQPAFTEEEERKLLETPNCPAIHSRVLHPWLTVQYEACGVANGPTIAKLQCCRDGICVCAYMHNLYTSAGPDFKFGIDNTCHWSMTCDGHTVQLYLHWRQGLQPGEAEYHMRCLVDTTLQGSFGMDVNQEIVALRRCLRNILEHAQTTRLQQIKEKLRCIDPPQDVALRKPPTKPRTKTTQASETVATDCLDIP